MNVNLYTWLNISLSMFIGNFNKTKLKLRVIERGTCLFGS